MRIQAFVDYHEIDDARQHRESAIELGAFPPKRGGAFKYYGLFYKGKRPSVDTVYKVLEQFIDTDFEMDYPYTLVNEETVKEELVEALNG